MGISLEKGMNLEEFKKYAKTVTRKEFITEGATGEYCPTKYELKCRKLCVNGGFAEECRECYTEACKDIKFKDDLEVDNMSNEKTFKEVIRDIKEGEVWECTSEDWDIKRVSLLDGSIFIEKHNEAQELTITELAKFKLQRKKVSFTEAFKAYEEGKEIEGVYSKRKYEKDPQMNMYVNGEYFESCKPSLSFSEINGGWYINE